MHASKRQALVVTHRRSVQIPTEVDGNIKKVKNTTGFYAPHLSRNILSYAEIVRKGCIMHVENKLVRRADAHSVNARRASSFRILTCFEKVCLGMSLAEFFRDPSLEYCAKGKNDGRLCVKEEYVTLAGFVIAKDNLIRNRDIFGFWLSELLPVRVLRLPMLSMSASFWPIRDHHVVYGAHCIVKGPLGLPTAQCSCEGALSRRSKALQQSTSKANAAVVHPGNTSGPEPTTEAVHKS